jgi:hypothetical protein
MTEEAIMAQGAAVMQECAEENCIITLGNKIGADYVVKGVVSRFRTMFTLTIQIYETEHGMLIASSSPIEDANVDNFIPKIRENAPEVFKKLVTYKDKPKVSDGTLDFGKVEKTTGINKLAVVLGAVGIAGIAYGVLQELEVKKNMDTYKDYSNNEEKRQSHLNKAEDAKTLRNVGYGVGAAFLAGGIVVQIAF